MRVYVELAHQIDAKAWQVSHRRGLVPNELPFGLESVAAQGASLRFRPRSSQRPLVMRIFNRLNAACAGLQWTESVMVPDHLSRRQSDVVLGWDEWTGIPAAWRSQLPGEPPVVSGIMNLTDWPELTSRERHILGGGMIRCAALFQHSGAQADLLVNEWSIPRSRINVVPFGIDADFFRPMSVEVEQGLIVSVGDDAHRDYRGLFDAFRLVRQHVPGARLLAATTTQVGDTDMKEVTIERSKLGPKRPHVYSSAAVVAVCCHPQVHGSGLSVVVEAMGCGRPWVATDSLGFRDHFNNGEGGILVPPGDQAAFADAVISLIQHPEEANRLGRIGRTLVETRLNTRVQGAAVAEVLRSVVG